MGCRICEGAGRARCPIHAKPILSRVRMAISGDSSFFGDSPPAVFIGHYGYPRVRAGVLAPPVPGDELDAPAKWFARRLGIPEVVEKRLSLLNLTFSADVKKPALSNQYFDEVSIAVTPTEVEAKTRGSLTNSVSFDRYNSPMGPAARLAELKVTANPKIPAKVDSIISERMPAAEAANELFNYGFDVYYLQRILSAGMLGKEKKLVPTRWSITAADSIISENLIEKIRGYDKIERVLVFHSRHLDNDFHVLLIPGAWAFEQIEGYSPGGTMMSDFEFHDGRKTYASNVAGGYYAGRLAVCEYLSEKRKQASVLILRSIGAGYFAPLGVWQVRENVRNAMTSPPAEFEDLKTALEHVFAASRLDRKAALKESKVLGFFRKQRSLSSFG
jgi:DNA repair protein NreA